jgi:ribosome-binding ATPase
MKIGLVGYQGGGKSTLFELLTGHKPDLSKAHLGQVGVTTVPDERFHRLVQFHKPKKETPAKIDLFDTPGLSRDDHSQNASRLGVIREAAALVQVIGVFNGVDPLAEARAFEDDMVLADLQVVSNRVDRLKKDLTKPHAHAEKDDLVAEQHALEAVVAALNDGKSLRQMPFTDLQEKFTKSFSLLTRKPKMAVLNTADSTFDAKLIADLNAIGIKAIGGPVGLELEVAALPEADRELFAQEMGLGEPCRQKLLRATFEITEQITFYTCDEKEVHAWLLKRGSTALEAAGTIHTDLAHGFIRAEIMSTDDLLRLGSEREVKAHGLHRTEGKEYLVRDGDEIVIRFSV